MKNACKEKLELHEEGVTRKNRSCNELVSQVARKINTCNGALNLVLYRKFDTRKKTNYNTFYFSCTSNMVLWFLTEHSL